MAAPLDSIPLTSGSDHKMPPVDQPRIPHNTSLRLEAHRAAWVHFNNMPLKELKPMARDRGLNIKWHARKHEFVEALVNEELKSRRFSPHEDIDATIAEAEEPQEVVAPVTPEVAPGLPAEWPEADEPQDVVAAIAPQVAPTLLAERPEARSQWDIISTGCGIVVFVLAFISLVRGTGTFIGKVIGGIYKLVPSTGEDIVREIITSVAKIAAKMMAE